MPNSPPKNLQGLDVEFGVTSGSSGFAFGSVSGSAAVGMNGGLSAVSAAPTASDIPSAETSKPEVSALLTQSSGGAADLSQAVQSTVAPAMASVPGTSAPSGAPPAQRSVQPISQQPPTGFPGFNGQSGQGVSTSSQSYTEPYNLQQGGTSSTAAPSGGAGGLAGQPMFDSSSWNSGSGIPAGAAMGMPGSAYPMAPMQMGFPMAPMGYQSPFDDAHFRAMSAGFQQEGTG